MASAEPTPVATNGAVTLAPRKFKASDLPLTSATRSAIEGLAHSFKKKGGYDAIRKQVWEKFEQSDYEAQVVKSILEVAEQELERNPSQLLTLERRKAATLIDGALDRSGVYQKADEVLDQLIDVQAIETRMRELRQAEIGIEAAREEQLRGSKTDEAYAAESAHSLEERDRIRRELRAKEEQILEEKRKIEREERKKRERERERELEKAEAKRKEERDARRREREKKEAERERERDREREERRKARERDREKDYDRDTRRRSRTRSPRHRSQERPHHRDRDRDRDRDKDHNRDRDRSRRRDSRERRRRDRSRDERDRGKPEELKKQLTKEDHERLEREALEDLLRESKKNTAKQPELEIDEALVPPPRRTKPASAIQPIRRDSIKNSETKKTPELTKPESKDSVKDAKDTKDVKDVKDVKEAKPPKESKEPVPPKETKEKDSKDSKDTKDTKAKDERRGSIISTRHHRDQSRGAEDDRKPRERDRDHDRDRARERSRSHAKSERKDRSKSRHRSDRRDRSRDRDRERDRERVPERDRDFYRPGQRDRSRSRIKAGLNLKKTETGASGADREPAPIGEMTVAMIAERGPAHPNLGLSDGTGVALECDPTETEKDHEKDRSRRSRSRSRPATSSKVDLNDAEAWKQGEIKKREQEAKAYLAAQREAREKGLPVPGVDDKRSRPIAIGSPISTGSETETEIGTGIGTRRRRKTGTATEMIGEIAGAAELEVVATAASVSEVVIERRAATATANVTVLGTDTSERESGIGIGIGIATVTAIVKEVEMIATKIATGIGAAAASEVRSHEERGDIEVSIPEETAAIEAVVVGGVGAPGKLGISGQTTIMFRIVLLKHLYSLGDGVG
ncbi:hypothetical protein Hte_006538 [Hypoxylon texense]